MSNTSTSGNLSFNITAQIGLIQTIVSVSLALRDLDMDGFMDVVKGYNSGIQISMLPSLVSGRSLKQYIQILR